MLLNTITIVSILLSILGYGMNIYDNILFVPLVFIGFVLLFVLIWGLSCIIATRFIDMDAQCENRSRLYRFYTNCIIESLEQLLNIKLIVSGKDILPQEKFLLVCNHRGAMDPLLTMGVLRKYEMGFVAKKELYKIPVISRLMHRSFCLCMNREDVKQSAMVIKRAGELIKEDKASIGIYPEGTRSHNDEMLPFMNGAFKIAKKADCPVVVATIRNTEHVMKDGPFKRTKVYLDFLSVLDKEFVKESNTAQISDAAREIMEKHLKSVKE